MRTMAEPIYAGMQSTDIMYYLLPPVVNCPVYVLLQTVYRRDTALKCGLAEAGKDRLAGRILGLSAGFLWAGSGFRPDHKKHCR